MSAQRTKNIPAGWVMVKSTGRIRPTTLSLAYLPEPKGEVLMQVKSTKTDEHLSVSVSARTLLELLAEVGVTPESMFFMPCGHEAELVTTRHELDRMQKTLNMIRSAVTP